MVAFLLAKNSTINYGTRSTTFTNILYINIFFNTKKLLTFNYRKGLRIRSRIRKISD